MKPSIILALACAATLGMSTAGLAEDPVGRADTNILSQSEIRGEVLKVDGDNYLVRDERTKKEVKFTLEKDVKASLERPLKPGDRIEAFLTPEGYAKTVRIDGPKGRDVERAGKDSDKTSGEVGKAGKDIGDIQAPGGFSKEGPSGKKGGQ
jgi:hypothetical protein